MPRMTRRLGVLDLGTNSTRLLVADVGAGTVRDVDAATAITRLGEGVDETHRLRPESMDRVLRCAQSFHERAVAHGAERTLAVATSAVRDATNGDEFLDRIATLGVEARCLTGDQEADLSFRGATLTRNSAAPTLVVDVGGGSTEIALGDESGVIDRASLDIGSVRLTERYFHSDPRTEAEVDQARAFLTTELRETRMLGTQPAALVGVAGTITSLATMALRVDPGDMDAIDGQRLTARDVAEAARTLAATPIATLRERPGLHPKRAPVIAAGALIVSETMRAAAAERLTVSVRDILHGAALELAEGAAA
jgi:exopolyphosphatase/guanosine-5'-triphosphate,3'-diphosphate pyrophosphatase